MAYFPGSRDEGSWKYAGKRYWFIRSGPALSHPRLECHCHCSLSLLTLPPFPHAHSPSSRISLAELRSENPRLAQSLRHDPLRHLRALEAACHAVAAEERPGYDKEGKWDINMLSVYVGDFVSMFLRKTPMR